jgi:hypothetical protein
MRNSAVILTGPVHSWAEREAVLWAAGHRQGGREVVDHLHFGRTDDHPAQAKADQVQSRTGGAHARVC